MFETVVVNYVSDVCHVYFIDVCDVFSVVVSVRVLLHLCSYFFNPNHDVFPYLN